MTWVQWRYHYDWSRRTTNKEESTTTTIRLHYDVPRRQCHFSHDPCSHVVQTGSEQGFSTGSEFGSCWRLASILLDRARSSSHRSGIVLAASWHRGVVLACRRWGVQCDRSRISKMLLRSTTATLRWYYDATTKVLRLYKNLFVLRCTTIFLDMSKNIVVLSGVVTVH